MWKRAALDRRGAWVDQIVSQPLSTKREPAAIDGGLAIAAREWNEPTLASWVRENVVPFEEEGV